MNEWISVLDELPPVYEWVFVKALKKEKIFGPNIFVACIGSYDDWECAYGDGYIPQEIEIRYWKKITDD